MANSTTGCWWAGGLGSRTSTTNILCASANWFVPALMGRLPLVLPRGLPIDEIVARLHDVEIDTVRSTPRPTPLQQELRN